MAVVGACRSLLAPRTSSRNPHHSSIPVAVPWVRRSIMPGPIPDIGPPGAGPDIIGQLIAAACPACPPDIIGQFIIMPSGIRPGAWPSGGGLGCACAAGGAGCTGAVAELAEG